MSRSDLVLQSKRALVMFAGVCKSGASSAKETLNKARMLCRLRGTWPLSRCCRRLCFVPPQHVSSVRMLIPIKHLEPFQPSIPQCVLWQHATHRPSNDLFRFLLHHLLVLDLLQSAWKHRVMAIHSLIRFLACRDDLFGIGDNDIVSEVLGLVIDRFMFAH